MQFRPVGIEGPDEKQAPEGTDFGPKAAFAISASFAAERETEFGFAKSVFAKSAFAMTRP